MDDDDLQQLYTWIDEIPLSRPKKNISRDFSDGVLAAEVVKHFLPRLVDLHNYTPANAKEQKKRNWQTLNRKVFCKLNFNVPDEVVNGVSSCNPGVIEFVLNNLRTKIDKYLTSSKKKTTPGSSQAKDHLVINDGDGDGAYDSSDIFYSAITKSSENPYEYASPPQIMPMRLPPPPNGMQHNYNPHVHPHPHHLGFVQDPSAPRRGTVPGAEAPQPTLINRGQMFKSRPQLQRILPSLDPRIAMEEKEQQLLEAQETIQILQAKIRRLEHLLQLKDRRMEEMSRRLQQQS
ncbi:sperm flagellar protein 1-like isoform X2 [Oscarella lobularis]|uniref:sperm flagellar protein 1-like isoform X2 n=1 Tax=Oscarella lobularis TaxID=121494 RepID=UPI003313C406